MTIIETHLGRRAGSTGKSASQRRAILGAETLGEQQSATLSLHCCPYYAKDERLTVSDCCPRFELFNCNQIISLYQSIILPTNSNGTPNRAPTIEQWERFVYLFISPCVVSFLYQIYQHMVSAIGANNSNKINHSIR